VSARRLLRDDPVQCRCCGLLAERRWLGEGEFRKRSLRGIRYGAPGDGEPDEWVVACPDCAAEESFVPAVRCAECLERPCVCPPPEAPEGFVSTHPPPARSARGQGD